MDLNVSQSAVTVAIQQVEATACARLLERILVGSALDLAMMLVSNQRDNAMLTSEILLRSPRRLWLAPEHPLIRSERVHLAEIARYPYVMLTVDEAKHASMRDWSHAALEPKTIVRTSPVDAARSMVAGGIGIAILSDLIYRPWSPEGQRISTRVIEHEVRSMDDGLAWRRDTKLSGATKAFRDCMRFAVVGLGPARPPVSIDHRYGPTRRSESEISVSVLFVLTSSGCPRHTRTGTRRPETQPAAGE
jgi:DNA-binding transcriptional LysR family regulator